MRTPLKWISLFYLFIVLSLVFILPIGLLAQAMQPPWLLEELDGDPSILFPFAAKFKIPNGSLTLNADGTATVSFVDGIPDDGIKDFHIDWGLDADQVNIYDIPGGTSYFENINITDDGQVSYTLSATPKSTSAVLVYINGVETDNGTDYTVSGTTITWTDESYTLEVEDDFFVSYDGYETPSVVTYTETFHVTATGDASDPTTEAGAWDLSDASNAANWNSGVDAVDGKIGAKDLVIFHDTFIAKGGFRVQGNGSSGKQITFQGDNCVIDANDSDSFCIRVAGESYLTFYDMILKNGTGSNFNGYDDTGNVRNDILLSYITSQDCAGNGVWIDIDHADGSLTNFQANDGTYTGNTLYGLNLQGTGASDYVNPVLLRNYTEYNDDEGLRVDYSVDGEMAYNDSYYDGQAAYKAGSFMGIQNVRLEVHHNRGRYPKAENLWWANCTDIDVHHNVLIGDQEFAACMFSSGVTTANYSNNSMNGQAQFVSWGENGQCTGLTMKNNSGDNCGTYGNFASANSSTYTAIDRNLWDENKSFDDNGVARTWSEWQGQGYDTNGFYESAEYADAGNDDLTLLSSSPCINAGEDLGDTYTYALDPTSTFPTDVRVKNQDDIGSGWEIGAYVYNPTSGLIRGEQTNLNASDISIADAGSYFIGTDVEEALQEVGLVRGVTREPTGFKDPADVIVTGNSTNRTVTLTGTVNAYYQGVLNSTIISGWTSGAHGSDTNEQYFLNYDGSTINWIAVSGGIADSFFQSLIIAFAFYDNTNSKWVYLRECHGLQPWETHLADHNVVGTYRNSGGALGDYVLASTTAADRRPSVEATVLHDEDNPTTNPVLNDSSYTNFYLSGAGATVNSVINQADIVPLSAARPYWNEFTGGSWQQTLMSNNFYMAVWVLCIPMAADADSQELRYLFIQGQTEDNQLSNIQALTPQDVSIGTLRALLPELIVTNKIIIRYTAGNWVITEVSEITGTSSSQTTSPAGNYLTSVTSDASLTGLGTPSSPLAVVDSNIDHGGISGLTDDDHTQYVLTDGTRDITGSTAVLTFDITNSLDTGVSAVQVVNDLGHRASMGIAGSNHAVMTPESVAFYSQGYAETYFINNGNVPFSWWTEVGDTHVVGAYTKKMSLSAAGDVLMDAGGNITTAGTIEGGTMTQGGQTMYDANDTPGGELGGTFDSFTVDATHSGSAHHTRSHAMTDTSDHTANTWNVFYSDGSGNIIELALGADGDVLQSNGAAVAPTFETPSAGGGLGANLSSTTNDILSDSNGQIVLGGTGGTYNNTVIFDFEEQWASMAVSVQSGYGNILRWDAVFQMGDDWEYRFGDNADVRMTFETTGTDNFQVGLDSPKYFSLLERTAMGHANRSPSGAADDSTLRLWADGATANTEYMDLTYSEADSDGYIVTGLGDLNFVPAGGDVEVTGNVIPEADGTRDLGVQTTGQWANVWADLINGSDIALKNGWRILESEKYKGYGRGFAIGNTGFVNGEITEKMSDNCKPVFVVTEEFIEFKGIRFNKKELALLKAYLMQGGRH